MELSKEQVVEALGNMSVMQVVELTKTLEDKWGVKAQPVALPGVVPDQSKVPGPEPEATEFALTLTEAGASKINVIKAVRESLGLGLKEAKDLVDNVPRVLKEGLSKADCDELSKKLEAAGAKFTVVGS